MSMYHCEGLVKEIAVKGGKVTFKLEPSAPYLFERKKDDGTMERSLLLVEPKSHTARIVNPAQDFIPRKPLDLNTLLIAKANRMRICLDVTLKYIVEVLGVL